MQGHIKNSGLKTADVAIKESPGRVYSWTLAWKGASVGEFCTLIDGADATGSDEVVAMFATANGSLQFHWPEGKRFDTAIFFNKGATAGQVYTTVGFV